MDIWKMLNEVYRPLHERAQKLAAGLRAKNIGVHMTYCNGHVVRRSGDWQTEYFPMPELELDTPAGRADLGLALDGSAWCELHLSRDIALALDYSALCAAFSIEVYGAELYLTDFYDASLDASGTSARICASDETEICITADFDAAALSVDEIVHFFCMAGEKNEGGL